MKTLLYLPLLILNLIVSLLPRKLFISLYAPSSLELRTVEIKNRNIGRLVKYKAKKRLL